MIGKNIGGFVYVHKDSLPECKPELQKYAAAALQIFKPKNYDVVKISQNQVSFLSYPDFFSNPHPELKSYVTVNLVDKTYKEYNGNSNPSILHRKELFISPTHPMHPIFKALSDAEERAGLLGKNAKGQRLQWNVFLRQKGYKVTPDHRLIKTDMNESKKNKTLENNELNRLKLIVTQFRKEIENEYDWKNDKTCFNNKCQDITQDLVKILKSEGFNAVRIGGYYYNIGDDWQPDTSEWDYDDQSRFKFKDSYNKWKHWWVEVDGYIIDVTADQFHPGEEKYYRIIIDKKPSSEYKGKIIGEYMIESSQSGAEFKVQRQLQGGIPMDTVDKVTSPKFYVAKKKIIRFVGGQVEVNEGYKDSHFDYQRYANENPSQKDFVDMLNKNKTYYEKFEFEARDIFKIGKFCVVTDKQTVLKGTMDIQAYVEDLNRYELEQFVDIYPISIPEKAFHATNPIRVDAISKLGLLPKGGKVNCSTNDDLMAKTYGEAVIEIDLQQMEIDQFPFEIETNQTEAENDARNKILSKIKFPYRITTDYKDDTEDVYILTKEPIPPMYLKIDGKPIGKMYESTTSASIMGSSTNLFQGVSVLRRIPVLKKRKPGEILTVDASNPITERYWGNGEVPHKIT